MKRPNILFLMTDQQRFDSIAALGNQVIYTPNLDRLVQRGVTFSNAYSTCPVCVPARYTIRTGCEPPTTRIFYNNYPQPLPDQPQEMTARCGPYLAQRMQALGYRTFGIGKFHSIPWDEPLGYETHLHSEELYGTLEQRQQDDYAAWVAREHPAYDFIEALMGERTEMYYMPQMSPMPAAVTVESWAARCAVEQIQAASERPYFGFVSFIGPHPPFAPPLPFNRMYDPDRMPDPICGELETDHMDEQIPWMNQIIWAEDIRNPQARILKARYYGEISYIDASPDANNTLICFFSDHGDHLGDHHAWQKESFFEASCHIPFLLSWLDRLPAGLARQELVCLTDLFGIATHAANAVETREGRDVLGMLAGTAAPRDCLVGCYGDPGTPLFKVMVREGAWKYIFLANGGGEQLFNLENDPDEHVNCVHVEADTVSHLRSRAAAACDIPGARQALDENGLKAFPYRERRRDRIYQFDQSRGITGFPKKPEDVLKGWSTK